MLTSNFLDMKKYFNFILVTSLALNVFTSCSEPDTALPKSNIPFFSEEFQNVQHNTVLDLTDWVNYSEAGTLKWKEKIYQGDGYAEFNSYGTSDAVAISWLISPEVDLSGKTNVKLSFQSAQNFVSNDANKVEAYASSDFDGTNFSTATWTKLDAIVATKSTAGYTFIKSGEVDLSSYETAGKVRVAFKATGSGTDTSLDGLFQINNVYLYTTVK